MQHEVEGSRPRTLTPPLPLFHIAPPISPKLWVAGGGLEPVVGDEDELVISLPHVPKFTNRGGIPTEALPE